MEKRILIFDDDPSILYSLSEGLKLAGFHVITAESSDEVMSHCHNHSFDLALIDFTLNSEEITGLDLIEAIHKIKYLPFLMITSTVDEEIILQAAKLGAVNYIIKPFSLESLIPQVHVGIIRAKHIFNLEIDTEFTRIINHAIGIIAARLSISLNQARSELNIKSRKARISKKELSQLIVDEQNAISSPDWVSKYFLN